MFFLKHKTTLNYNIITLFFSFILIRQLKATFQTKTLKELKQMHVVSSFNHDHIIKQYNLQEHHTSEQKKKQKNQKKSSTAISNQSNTLKKDNDNTQDVLDVKYLIAGIQAKERASRNGSTVVDIFLSKIPQTSLF